MTVKAIKRWRTNGHMIADVAKLGYLEGRVLDLTYGKGAFWTQFMPAGLVACDLDPAKSPIGYGIDFTDPPKEWIEKFDTVVIDPGYKLNGRPDPIVDERYGVHEKVTIAKRKQLILDGVEAAARLVVVGGFLLVKVMDQVANNQQHWLTDEVRDKLAVPVGKPYYTWTKIDRFDLVGHARPQKMDGRTQRHAHGRGSTLLVFHKEALR